MRYRVLAATLLAFLVTLPAIGQENPLWLRYPAISPDGQTIAFEFKGDIYSVPAAGGTATPLTLSESYEFAPVWSHDGKLIAFASDRYGNFDVFVMPATGGEAKRLTFHSAREMPSTFTADDKPSSSRPTGRSSRPTRSSPSALMTQLYSVPVAGGRVTQVLAVPALDATFDSDRRQGSSTTTSRATRTTGASTTPRRSRATSGCYDFKTNTYRQLTTFAGEDRNPVFDANDDDFYYLSEQSGSFNVYKSSLAHPEKSDGRHALHQAPGPVPHARETTARSASASTARSTRCSRAAQPRSVSVRVAVDGRATLDKIVPVNDGFTEMKLSPNGKEFAYVFRGEIFVTSMEGGITKRITNTPWQERSVSFSPDGRSLVYAAEKDNNWNVYTVSIVAQGGAVLLRLHRPEGGTGRRHAGRGVSSPPSRPTARKSPTSRTASRSR